ncbi:hypothetical protein IMY05_C0121000400 [Salix suchowensis]|nr:hypothetical protein IMY05_C0121000400 [Salix suchowensis]
MYSTMEREHKRIQAQEWEKLGHGLKVLEREVASVKEYSMKFQIHGKRKYNTKKLKDEGGSMCLSFKNINTNDYYNVP